MMLSAKKVKFTFLVIKNLSSCVTHNAPPIPPYSCTSVSRIVQNRIRMRLPAGHKRLRKCVHWAQTVAALCPPNPRIQAPCGLALDTNGCPFVSTFAGNPVAQIPARTVPASSHSAVKHNTCQPGRLQPGRL